MFIILLYLAGQLPLSKHIWKRSFEGTRISPFWKFGQTLRWGGILGTKDKDKTILRPQKVHSHGGATNQKKQNKGLD